MSPNELEVLRVFEGADTVGKGMISKRLGVSTDYAEHLCKSLFRKGYLEPLPKGQYLLTQRGFTALLENLSRIRDDLKRNMLLLDEYMEMAKLKLVKLRKREGELQA